MTCDKWWGVNILSFSVINVTDQLVSEGWDIDNVCEEISERAETDDSSRDGSEPDVSGEDWSDDNTSQITVSWGD